MSKVIKSFNVAFDRDLTFFKVITDLKRIKGSLDTSHGHLLLYLGHTFDKRQSGIIADVIAKATYSPQLF